MQSTLLPQSSSKAACMIMSCRIYKIMYTAQFEHAIIMPVIQSLNNFICLGVQCQLRHFTPSCEQLAACLLSIVQSQIQIQIILRASCMVMSIYIYMFRHFMLFHIVHNWSKCDKKISSVLYYDIVQLRDKAEDLLKFVDLFSVRAGDPRYLSPHSQR